MHVNYLRRDIHASLNNSVRKVHHVGMRTSSLDNSSIHALQDDFVYQIQIHYIEIWANNL